MSYTSYMRRIALFLALFPFAFPALAVAADAGFAPGALWLSSTSAHAGDAVTLYTVVYDSTPQPLEGDVAFSVDGAPFGSQHFKLAAGASQIVSISWTAIEGSHSFSAKIENAAGVAGVASATTNTASIAVAKPAPTIVEQYVSQATGSLGSTSPALSAAVSNVIAKTEDWRAQGADFLQKALYTDQATAQKQSLTSSSTSKGAVLGTSTLRVAPASASAPSGFFAQAKHLLLTILLWIFRSAYLFYPFFALVVFILLYIAKRTLTRPGY